MFFSYFIKYYYSNIYYAENTMFLLIDAIFPKCSDCEGTPSIYVHIYTLTLRSRGTLTKFLISGDTTMLIEMFLYHTSQDKKPPYVDEYLQCSILDVKYVN